MLALNSLYFLISKHNLYVWGPTSTHPRPHTRSLTHGAPRLGSDTQ